MALINNANLPNIGFQYLKLLGAEIHADNFAGKLESNPYYPSIYSLVAVFHSYGIDSDAYEISFNKLINIGSPFIAFTAGEDGREFMLITNITSETVDYVHENGKKDTMGYYQFGARYKGVILIAETTAATTDNDYQTAVQRKKRKSFAAAFTTAGIFFTLILLVLPAITALPVGKALSYLFFAVTALTAFAVSCLLLVLGISKNDHWIKEICNLGKRTSCDAVLKSRASKIWGLEWSEIGLVYFAGLFIFLVYPYVSIEPKITVLTIVSFLSATFIPYSIYYQWRIVKQWCPLCLGIQSVLLLNLIWGINNITLISFGNINYFSLLSGAFVSLMIPLIGLLLVKPLLENKKDIKIYKPAYERLQYHPDLFNNMLKSQPKLLAGYENIGIDIGSAEGENYIIKVCNPYCGPCAKAHPKIEALLAKNPSIRFKIIFFPNGSQSDHAIRHFVSLAKSEPIEQVHHALSEWYTATTKDLASFSKKHPADPNHDTNTEIEEMRKWCLEAGIAGTPTFFINGYQLPSDYDIEELSHVLN